MDMATVPLRSLQRSCSWPSEVPPTSTATAPKRWRSLSLRLLRQIVGPRLCLMPSPHLPRTAGDGRRQSASDGSSRSDCGRETPDLRTPKPPPLFLLPVAADAPARKRQYRLSLSHQFLDSIGPNDEFEHGSRPRTYAMKLRDEDGHGSLPVRRLNNSGVSCTRSLEHLDRLEPETDFMRWRSEKSIHSLSSEEDLVEFPEDNPPAEDYPINTESDAESTGDELDRLPPMQTEEQAFGDIELVVGLSPPTCKCTSKQSCYHCDYWKGEVTEEWHMRLYRDGSKEEEITLPPENMLLSEEKMEKLCKLTPESTVYTQPF